MWSRPRTPGAADSNWRQWNRRGPSGSPDRSRIHIHLMLSELSMPPSHSRAGSATGEHAYIGVRSHQLLYPVPQRRCRQPHGRSRSSVARSGSPRISRFVATVLTAADTFRALDRFGDINPADGIKPGVEDLDRFPSTASAAPANSRLVVKIHAQSASHVIARYIGPGCRERPEPICDASSCTRLA